MGKKLIAFVTCMAALALVAGVSARSSSAATSQQFACYSVNQVNPGTWAVDEPDVFATWSTFATGYWTPYAETTVPTKTKVGDYYLTCSMPTGWTQTGAYILGDGTLVNMSGPTDYLANSQPIPGVFPVIQLTTAPPTTTTP